MRMTRGDDSGFTLMETVVAGVVAMIMGASILGVLASGERSERDLTELAASQEDLRRGLVELLQDIRAAEPLGFPSTVASSVPASTSGPELRLQRREPGATQPTLVRWHVDGGGTTTPPSLVRDVVQVDSAGHVVAQVATYRLPGVSTATSNVEFFDDDGDAIPVTDQQRISDCAATVRITLEAAASQSGRHPASVVSEAQLRNQAESMPWCA